MTNNKLMLAVLMASVSTLALPNLTMGQEEQQQAQAEVEAIIVTGTRIQLDGYEAPTPVTIVSTNDLQLAAPGGISDALNQLPQFLGSTSPTQGRKLGPQTPHGNFLNLRNLGVTRNLVMLDNVRMPPTTYHGTVNVDIIPQMLVQRVEVVTAGASAAYGSDAVAGVTNYLLDHNFIGTKGKAQYGISTYGDAKNYRVGVAGGYKIGDIGHVIASVERFESDGIIMSDRPRLNTSGIAAGRCVGSSLCGSPGTASNPYVLYKGANWATISPGGNILGGPLAGTYFPSAGVSRPYDAGIPTGSAGHSVGGDGTRLGLGQSVSEDIESTNALLRWSFDIGDTMSAYAMGIYSDVEASHIGPGAFDFGRRVFSGNPFIPTAIQTRMTNENIDSFGLLKYTVNEMGYIPGVDNTKHYTIFAGIDGEIELAGTPYSWDFNYAYGNTKHDARATNLLENRKWAAANDAVTDPATGSIVCKVTLTHPGVWPGCVPFNVLGVGASSAAAREYVTGISEYFDRHSTHIIGVNLQGEPFTLPAGPFSMAIGAEYRDQKINMTSNADPAIPRSVEGLRGIGGTNTSRFFFTNVGTASGNTNVKEAYAEFNLPLLKDTGFAEALDLNAAVRLTDYSTSGTVTTWKAGATWRPIDELNLRLTRSRDIRAPTLFNLFAGANISRSCLTDPLTKTNACYDNVSAGNPILKPETSNQLNFGFVYTPDYIPEFSLAVDFYDLKLKGAITTTRALAIVEQCEDSGGVDPICIKVERPFPRSNTTADNFPVRILSGPINNAFTSLRGIDVEATHRTDFYDGSLTTRLLLTYLDKFTSQNSPASPIIAQAGQENVVGVKAVLNFNYVRDNFHLFLQERFIGPQGLGTTRLYAWREMAAQTYTDVTIGYDMPMAETDVHVYFSVNNLLNNKPPFRPNRTAPEYGIPTLVGIYDSIGRMFTMGIRVGL
jgi:iron complex outermembrane receptor protein